MTTVGGTGELELLRRIQPFLEGNNLAVAAGDDDTAVLFGADSYTVLSTDMAVEGIHFDLAWMSPQDAGWRALALALGDLAAKGADPSWALISLAVPRSWDVDDFVGLFQGFHALSRTAHVMLVGGDTSAIDGPAVISLTVAGWTKKRPLGRSEAKAGWSIAVTGPLGAAALALRRHESLRLVPLLAEGRRLNQLGLCCGDISDGLIRELEKFEHMAHVGSRVRAAEIPAVEGATWQDALSSGEEAELVCVGPNELVQLAGLKPIGVLTEDRHVVVIGADDMPLQLSMPGYDHFA